MTDQSGTRSSRPRLTWIDLVLLIGVWAAGFLSWENIGQLAGASGTDLGWTQVGSDTARVTLTKAGDLRATVRVRLSCFPSQIRFEPTMKTVFPVGLGDGWYQLRQATDAAKLAWPAGETLAIVCPDGDANISDWKVHPEAGMPDNRSWQQRRRRVSGFMIAVWIVSGLTSLGIALRARSKGGDSVGITLSDLPIALLGMINRSSPQETSEVRERLRARIEGTPLAEIEARYGLKRGTARSAHFYGDIHNFGELLGNGAAELEKVRVIYFNGSGKGK